MGALLHWEDEVVGVLSQPVELQLVGIRTCLRALGAADFDSFVQTPVSPALDTVDVPVDVGRPHPLLALWTVVLPIAVRKDDKDGAFVVAPTVFLL